jgi:hypothetical protein
MMMRKTTIENLEEEEKKKISIRRILLRFFFAESESSILFVNNTHRSFSSILTYDIYRWLNKQHLCFRCIFRHKRDDDN